MSLAAIVTLLAVALVVAALALYLITVIAHLKHVHFTLGTIIAGLWSIANQTQPLDQIVGEINRDLSQVRQQLEGVVASVAASRAAPAPAAPQRQQRRRR